MNAQMTFDDLPPEPRFNGPDYVPARDNVRLTGQILRVWECMRDQQWRTLRQIEAITHDPQASISAQLRHLRKERFGGHTLNKEHLGDGLYRYQIVPSSDEPPVKGAA